MVTPRIRLPDGNYLVKRLRNLPHEIGYIPRRRHVSPVAGRCARRRMFLSTRSAVVHVLEKPAPRRRPAPPLARASVTDAHHQHVRADGMEPVPLLEVALELRNQAVFDVHDALTDLADGVLMVPCRDLVVDRAIAKPNSVQRAGRRERLQGTVDSAARETSLLA